MDYGASGQPAMARPARKRHLKFFTVAAALLAHVPSAASPIAPAPPPLSIVRATPALWIVRDADTTIYLFGTFHSLDNRTVWMENGVKTAFRQSDELVLETIVPDRGTVQRSAASVGAGRSAFIKGTERAMADARSRGMSVDHGADSVLRRLAEQDGKKVSGLEEFGEQLKALAAIPAGAPAPASIAPATKPVTVAGLLESWRSGDNAAFADVLASLERRAPQVYEALIAKRNVRWASWIADRLQQPGTVFVAVGTGHLTGKDSVQKMLAARGIGSYRIA